MRRSRSRAQILHREVRRLRVMEDERRDAGLGLHHELVGELHADLLRAQQP